MKVQFIQDEQFYTIRNYSVARNPLFSDKAIQEHFREKMLEYLEPLCVISAYHIGKNSFEMVLKLKPREEVEEFYIEKYGKEWKLNPIPETTYIFSQQMSNLQVSLVKKVNYKFSRKGTLMAGRFQKFILETPEELLNEISRLNSIGERQDHSGIWLNRLFQEIKPMTSFGLYSGESERCLGSEDIAIIRDKNDLAGKFTKLKTPELFPILDYHQRKIYRCLAKHLE